LQPQAVDAAFEMRMERLLHSYFRLIARYNAWANGRLYEHLGGLTEKAHRSTVKSRGAAAQRLLNARLAADKLWLARLNGYEAYERAVGEELPLELDELRDAQLAQDVELLEYVETLAEEDLLRPTSYDSESGERHTNAQYEILSHLFADQIASRARLGDLLEPAPDLAMLSYFRDTELGARPLHP
jgi:uncharacterized damage-inducible protein DinB